MLLPLYPGKLLMVVDPRLLRHINEHEAYEHDQKRSLHSWHELAKRYVEHEQEEIEEEVA